MFRKNIVIIWLSAMCCLMPAMAQVKVKNVIFVVGDGTGVAQVYASIVQAGDKSAFLRFPVSGFSRTYCLDRYTTDSGAGGTALMTGHKVNYHAIGEAPDGTDYPSFLELADANLGKSSGFVVTSSVLDATPASTYAHVPDRKLMDSISIQMARCRHSIMIGGDYGHFLRANRKDNNNPIDTLRARGYQVTFSPDSMRSSNSDKLVMLFGKDEYPPSAKKRNGLLPDGVKKALDILSKNPNGFTLLVEGSQIDWACHNNDAPYMFEELAEFDSVLNYILDWAEKDGETLVIVTADHETGGVSLPKGNIEDGTSKVKFSTQNHTGIMVPVFAYGPGSERFTGIMQNTDIFYKINDLLQGK